VPVPAKVQVFAMLLGAFGTGGWFVAPAVSPPLPGGANKISSRRLCGCWAVPWSLLSF